MQDDYLSEPCFDMRSRRHSACARRAELAVAGDKTGVNQDRFYGTLIKRADARFDQHVEAAEEKEKVTAWAWNIALFPPRTMRRALVSGTTGDRSIFGPPADRREVGLGDLRTGRSGSRKQVAKKIGGRQVYVSRFEKRSDVRLSKLREYVEALGGELELLVTFPDSSAYRLARLGSHALSPGVGLPGDRQAKRQRAG